MNKRKHTGFTLIEVILSASIMGILLIAMASAIVLASRAIPDSTKPMDQAIEVTSVIAWIQSDLRFAIHVPVRTDTAITITVADRDADGFPETIAYAWSGTVGDPLTRTYNGGSTKSILDDVHGINFQFNLQPRERDIRVLFVVPDASSLTTNDESKKARMEGWGFDVTNITASSTHAAYVAATSIADVVYVSEDIISSNVGTKLTSTPIGVIFEKHALVDEFYISDASYDYSNDRVRATNNSHPITTGFSTGPLVLFDSNQEMLAVNGTIANGATELTTRPLTAIPSLLVVDAGGQLLHDEVAAGRRVLVPWSGDTHNFNELNGDGLTLMKRCIQWAAGDHVVAGVQIKLRATGQTSQTETNVRLLNRMAVP
jgi:prepilin-type N-terminal cleavage/methylation domain-containing protein